MVKRQKILTQKFLSPGQGTTWVSHGEGTFSYCVGSGEMKASCVGRPDCCPLSWLHNTEGINGKLLRGRLLLGDFGFGLQSGCSTIIQHSLKISIRCFIKVHLRPSEFPLSFFTKPFYKASSPFLAEIYGEKNREYMGERARLEPSFKRWRGEGRETWEFKEPDANFGITVC